MVVLEPASVHASMRAFTFSKIFTETADNKCQILYGASIGRGNQCI